MSQIDVPSPIDLQDMTDAVKWESTAMLRPFREDFFQAFANELSRLDKSSLRVLELGSGPGFLALHLLNRFPALEMTLLDFSAPMHELAGKRLANHLDRVNFVLRSFKEPGWSEGLGKFDAVVTNQAVHELRHKNYARQLHEAVRIVLDESAPYLVCDHYCGEGAMSNNQLYMTRDEHRVALELAGFEVTEVLVKGGRALYHAAAGNYR